MLSYDAALNLLIAAVKPLSAEHVPLAQALGRVLALPVIAAIDSPRSTVSTMDGYAVMGEGQTDAWTVIGTAFPGEPFAGAVVQGQAVRIFTGASLPVGATQVVLQENVVARGDQIKLMADCGAVRWMRAAASDFAAGDAFLESGHIIDARALVALAGADIAKVAVTRRPRVWTIATGSELVPPGEARRSAHAVPDSLSVGLAAFVRESGGELIGQALFGDEPHVLSEAAGLALVDADVIVISGGASVGERDYARTMWADLGLDVMFAKVAIKPGKPIWVGRVNDCWVMGLPGNPTSAMVTARLFLAPLLAGLRGSPVDAACVWGEAGLAAPLPPTGNRETFHRARKSADGTVTPLANQDSGAQATLAVADCLIRTAPGTNSLAAGALVTVLDW